VSEASAAAIFRMEVPPSSGLPAVAALPKRGPFGSVREAKSGPRCRGCIQGGTSAEGETNLREAIFG
jgi:hypothetical protein